MTSPTETQTVTLERTFPHPVEKLWRALTQSDLLAQWLMNNDFKPTTGHKFQLRNQPMQGWDGIIQCEVLIVDPLKQLSYTWSAFGVDTVVLFTLTPAEDGTTLRVEQSGFRADQPQNYNGAKYGWNNFLGRLETLLNGDAQ